jgi:hypothetical protein
MYDFDFTGVLIAIAVVSAIVGWAAIETLLWVFSHITITWG